MIDAPIQKSSVPVLAVLVAGFLLLVCIGYLVFRSDAAMVRGNEMSRDRAIFTVVNAITLTGFQQTVATSEYLPGGKWMIAALMAGGSIFYLLSGGMLVARISRLPWSDAQIIVASIVITTIATLAGAAALMSWGQPLFDALFLSLSSFANCGLYVGDLPRIDNIQTHGVTLPLMVLGGVGAPVILDLRDRLLGRRNCLSHYTQVVLSMTAAIYLVGLLVFFAFDTLVAASAHSINSRGGGFQFQFAHEFPRPMQWIYVLLMLVGGASAGTTGGIKVNTIHSLARGIRDNLQRRPASRSFGIALLWIGVYVAIVFVGLLLMLGAVPQMPADRLLFMVVSAVGGVGMSHDPVSIVKDGLYLLILLMILGKLLPLLALIWMAQTRSNDEAEMPIG